jgi:hypothetical protein
MRKLRIIGLVAPLAFCHSTAALAQDLGLQGDLTLGIERAFGFHWTTTSWDNVPPDQDNDTSHTVVGIGWYRAETAHHNPRVGLDYFIVDQLSLGGSLGFWSAGGDRDGDGFMIFPRVGYVIPFGDIAGFWPRGGLAYYSEGGGQNWDQLVLGAEGSFYVRPLPDWAILFGPTMDLGVTGGVGDADFNQHSIGLTFGLLGRF